MINTPSSEQKIYSPTLGVALKQWISEINRPLVFTNGCFDILHRGHVAYLESAARLGQALVVGINSDESTKRQDKGADRPINCLDDRLAIVAALACVDAVVPFDDDTPLNLILEIRPEVLVKGGDWPIPDIVGYKEVTGWGGEVHSIDFKFERSTTGLLAQIRKSGNL